MSDAAGTISGFRLSRIAMAILGLFFIAAAILKAHSPDGLMRLSRYVYVKYSSNHVAVPIESIIIYAVSALLVFDISLGVLLIARWRPRLVLGVAIGALVVFSLALGALILDKSAPSCGCSGALRLADDARTENTIALGKNLLLIAACVWLRRHAHSANGPARPQGSLLDLP